MKNHSLHAEEKGHFCQPRGVPDSAKLLDESNVAGSQLPVIGALFPVTTYKHTELINYLNYKIQIM